MPGEDRQRLDKWLWFARLVRTRALAAALVEAGHVRVNRQKVLKPAHSVRPGDILTVALGGRVRVLEILGQAARRGAAASAQGLYRDAGATAGMPIAEGGPPEKEDASGHGNC